MGGDAVTSFAVVCTTINDGAFLKPYAEEILASGATVRMVVIPDRKTPKELYAAADDVTAMGVEVECPDVSVQEAFLASVGAAGVFPLDSDGRRNIGYLMAYESGADVMVSVDDDNLPGPGWFSDHEVVVAPPARHEMAFGAFWNPCNMLDSEAKIWARGYPYSRRWEYPPARRRVEECEVSVNSGLWVGDPDVDAITRLAVKPVTTGLVGSRVLAKGTWAPVNSQNTALRRDAVPAYAYFESAKRFADIWQGYFAQACAKTLGHHVRFGTPVADCGVRNDHTLLGDLELEVEGILMLDEVLKWLTEVQLTGSTYAETYECLWHELCAYIANASTAGSSVALKKEQRKILLDIAVRMRRWIKVCGVLA